MSYPLGDLGPCELKFGDTTLSENARVTFRTSDDVAPHRTARTGTAPKDEVYTGKSCEVEAVLVECSLVELAAIIPGASVDGNELMVATNVGTNARSIADELVIKKIEDGVASADETKWLTIFVAAPIPDIEQVYDAETDREVAKVIFRGYPVSSVPSGETYEANDLFAIGYGQTA